jgi:hypothetical protein
MIAALTVALIVPCAAFAGVGYDGGFYIADAEDNFKLKFNARVQSKLFWEHQTGQDDQISFTIRRAQLGIKSFFHERVVMGFTLKHAQTQVGTQNFANAQVGGAFASIEIIPQLAITIGMVGLPLDLMSETSSAWYILPEAPITATQDDGISSLTPLRSSFGTPDGLGINLSGGHWKWFYSASVVNGAESNYIINPDKKMSFGFRTGFNILDPVPGSLTDFACSETPKLTLNLGTMYQAKRIDPNTNADIDYIWTSTLGVGFRWGGFALNTEGYYRKTKMSSIGTAIWARPNLTDIGWYATAAYYVLPKKFEVAAQAGQTIRQGPDNDAWQLGGGLNYYIFDNNLKLQLAYTLTVDFDDVTGTRSNKIHNVAIMTSAIF